MFAAAILDPLLHHIFTGMIQRESYRLEPKGKTSLLGRAEEAN